MNCCPVQPIMLNQITYQNKTRLQNESLKPMRPEKCKQWSQFHQRKTANFSCVYIHPTKKVSTRYETGIVLQIFKSFTKSLPESVSNRHQKLKKYSAESMFYRKIIFTHNGWRYEIVGDCGLRHYHPITNFDAGQKLRITT